MQQVHCALKIVLLKISQWLSFTSADGCINYSFMTKWLSLSKLKIYHALWPFNSLVQLQALARFENVRSDLERKFTIIGVMQSDPLAREVSKAWLRWFGSVNHSHIKIQRSRGTARTTNSQRPRVIGITVSLEICFKLIHLNWPIRCYAPCTFLFGVYATVHRYTVIQVMHRLDYIETSSTSLCLLLGSDGEVILFEKWHSNLSPKWVFLWVDATIMYDVTTKVKASHSPKRHILISSRVRHVAWDKNSLPSSVALSVYLLSTTPSFEDIQDQGRSNPYSNHWFSSRPFLWLSDFICMQSARKYFSSHFVPRCKKSLIYMPHK